MTIEVILLLLAGVALVAALLLTREAVVLGAVLAYTLTLMWLIFNDISLVLPGLALAIMVGVAGLVRIVGEADPSQSVTTGRNPVTNNFK
ncbi:hypothetical protein [Magnetospirillum sp. UT-4]|uniref:hypothetical protein n=1 Tax=Magnetospirillum sp. UT-4 TaxID=2681467 RepID=UPI0013837AAD|nr:hypothetical protein [Magnetospirillum sp. UT-4]CAA7626462.1 exported hypothetical protein [Magnetospirillum sp. UT-4]